MESEYEAWMHSGAHRRKNCVDCHLPNENKFRQVLAKAGTDVPVKVDLELKKYLEDRGEKKLKFKPSMEIKDPFGVQDRF